MEETKKQSFNTREDLIKYLRSYVFLKKDVDLLQYKVQQLQRALEEPKGMTISDIGPIDGGTHISRAEQFSRLADIEKDYIQALTNAEKRCLEIKTLIDSIPSKSQRQVLEHYYCCDSHIRMINVANDLNYSYDYCKELLYNGINCLCSMHKIEVSLTNNIY